MKTFKQFKKVVEESSGLTLRLAEAKRNKKTDKEMKDDGWSVETIEISCSCCQHKMKELDEMAMPSHNLNGMFDEFNKKHFGNSITKVPVKYASLKGKSGVASAEVYIKRVGRKKEYSLKKLNWIKVNKNVLMDKLHTGDIVMHEMIHLVMFMQGIFRTSGDPKHGREFVADKTVRERTYGRPIPLTDDVKHELSDSATKKLGIFTYEKPDGTFVYQLYYLNPWQKEKDSIIYSVQRILKQAKETGRATQVLNYKIKAGVIDTTLHLETKVKRGFIMSKIFSGYAANSKEKAEILKNMQPWKESMNIDLDMFNEEIR